MFESQLGSESWERWLPEPASSVVLKLLGVGLSKAARMAALSQVLSS